MPVQFSEVYIFGWLFFVRVQIDFYFIWQRKIFQKVNHPIVYVKFIHFYFSYLISNVYIMLFFFVLVSIDFIANFFKYLNRNSRCGRMLPSFHLMTLHQLLMKRIKTIHKMTRSIHIKCYDVDNSMAITLKVIWRRQMPSEMNHVFKWNI